MRERLVAFAPEARDDLLGIYDWIAGAAGPVVALAYVERLAVGSERGSLRADVRPGLRVIGFERRVNVAFVIEEARVVVLRVFRGGRDWEREVWDG